jgi:hypothetical protein
VIVTDDFLVPPEFWERQDPKLDKAALLAALKRADAMGENIPGACLSEPGTTIQIK